jgi:hypothetical protein
MVWTALIQCWPSGNSYRIQPPDTLKQGNATSCNHGLRVLCLGFEVSMAVKMHIAGFFHAKSTQFTGKTGMTLSDSNKI